MQNSLDYCINTWDPKRKGVIEEPHHNTYDIEFWGPSGMINSYYTGALQAFVAMGEHLEKDMTEYRELLDKSIDYMENQLYDGEYFIQNIRWKELQASDPTKVQSVNSNYSKEGLDLLENRTVDNVCLSVSAFKYTATVTRPTEEKIFSRAISCFFIEFFLLSVKVAYGPTNRSAFAIENIEYA